jgi:hypothetical protein
MGNFNKPAGLADIVKKMHQRIGRLERTYVFPRYTTAGRPSASLMDGQIIKNTTTGKLEGSDGTTWNALW